jgi:hypothetical protein
MSDSRYKPTWDDMTSLLIKRFGNAIANPTFIISFGAVIIFGGGAGIWIPNWFGNDDNSAIAFFKVTDLLTYGIAILSAIAADGLIDDTSKEKGAKSLKALALFVGSIAIVLLIYGYKITPKDMSSTYSNLGTILVLLLWFFVYANDEKYDDRQSPQNPIGGSSVDIGKLEGRG